MKISNKKTLVVILLIILITLLAAYFFRSPVPGDAGMNTINEDMAPPLPGEEMDMVYLYTDNQGMAHFSDQPPVGYDYQVVYIPRQTSDQKRDSVNIALAKKAKKILRGEIPANNMSNTKKSSSADPRPLPRTTAGDILSKSNELRQQEEKQGRE